MKDFKLNIDEMMEKGVHFGHRISKLHPKMKPYVSGVKNTIHIIDLEKTVEKFGSALKFIEELITKGGVLLVVGTKIQVRELVKKFAQECGIPYVSERWLGGTFTNFDTILKRIEYYKELERKKEAGELEKYTKKERIKIDKEIQALRIKFEGIKNMTKLPEAVFILDIKKDELTAKEARRRGVKVIGVCHTNVDPDLTDYPIPANDDAISSIQYILEKVAEVIKNTKKREVAAEERSDLPESF